MRSSADERIHGLTVLIPLTTVKSRVRLPGDIISRLRLRQRFIEQWLDDFGSTLASDVTQDVVSSRLVQSVSMILQQLPRRSADDRRQIIEEIERCSACTKTVS